MDDNDRWARIYKAMEITEPQMMSDTWFPFALPKEYKDERDALQAIIDACMERLAELDRELRHKRTMCIHDYDGRICKLCGFTRHRTPWDPE